MLPPTIAEHYSKQPKPFSVAEQELEDLLRERPRTLEEIGERLNRSVAKTKALTGSLTLQGRIHRRQDDVHAAAVWVLGPPPSLPDAAPERVGVQYFDSLVRPRTTREDLIAHGSELLRAPPDATDASLPHFRGLPSPDDSVEALSHKMMIAIAIQRTIVQTAKGETFVAVPRTDKDAKGNRICGRRYLRITPGQLGTYRELDARFEPDAWSDANPDGSKKSPTQIKRELTILADEWIYDGTSAASYIDSDRRFHFRCWAPLDDVQPEFSKTCDEYLRTFGKKGHAAILDYTANLRDLSRPSVVIVLRGSHGVGKDLICLCWARLFRKWGGPCSAARAANNFNGDLKDSPIVVASEQLPENWNGEPMSVDTFKELPALAYREINEKNQPPVKQIGCTRWAISSNNANFMPSTKPLDRMSADAVLARILAVEAPLLDDGETSAPAKYLADHGGMEFTKYWVTAADGGAGELVRHFRWVIEKHPITRPDGRFGVQANPGHFASILRTGNRVGSLVVGGIVAYLTGDRTKSMLGKAVRPGNGQVLVQLAALHDHWATLVATTSVDSARLDSRRMAPSAAAFAREVGESVCEPLDAEIDGDKRSWRFVRLELLLEHAKDMGLDVEALEDRIYDPAPNAFKLVEVDRGTS
jgi:hypothetical protein